MRDDQQKFLNFEQDAIREVCTFVKYKYKQIIESFTKYSKKKFFKIINKMIPNVTKNCKKKN